MLRVFAWVVAGFLLLGLATLTTVDRSSLEEQDFYKSTFAQLANSTWSSSSGEHWMGGWATVNVTPAQPAALVGYSPRGPYTFVQDSSHVKALTLSNGKSSIAWLNYELLIVHPRLADQVRAGVQKAGISVDQLIFTATHTHSGLGGYMPGLVGSLAFGGYDEQVVEQLVAGSVRALQKALASQDTVMLAFKKTSVPDLVSNRFVKGGATDPYVRQVLFQRKDGKKATFITLLGTCHRLEFQVYGALWRLPRLSHPTLGGGGSGFCTFCSRHCWEAIVPLRKAILPSRSMLMPKPLMHESARIPVQLHLQGQAQFRNSKLDIQLGEPQLRVTTNLRYPPLALPILTWGDASLP